ncbi:hypothetical protein HMPREF1863_01200 [Aedoeadaptatus coxii]|uniref:Uncharacterized protein n=1 Tax=Aedoeadaptatus coxii TaxID=755172 RepID=A0A134AE89_9FIRM|nr:hypothetical protein HMPREF1863_01200 [Peptoniphilus coxii]
MLEPPYQKFKLSNKILIGNKKIVKGWVRRNGIGVFLLNISE